MTTSTTASRKFSVHPQMIYSLITAQAGTLGKAVLENIMNSVDAGATKVTIEATRSKITIVDDGHGFRSVQEIEDCFEVFGFPHESGARLYGQFGIGRAQLWSFCSAIWRTNTFTMDVDIKNRGLDYRLKENQKAVQGLSIESKFYTPLSTHDIQVFKQELKELALYAQIPVILNGEVLNSDPSEFTWTHETADAWIKLSDSAVLTVYNLGVLVKKYPAYQVGSGGVVVTKPGVRLALNMARNDVLVSECLVWKRIKPFIQKKSDEKIRRKTTRISDTERQNRIPRFLCGDLSLQDVRELKLITDILGRGHTVQEFLSRCHGVVTTADEGSRLGERAHSSKLAFVLHPQALMAFGVDTVKGFEAALFGALSKQNPSVPHLMSVQSRIAFHEELTVAVPLLKEGYETVPSAELTPKEAAALFSLEIACYAVRAAIRNITGEPYLGKRSLSAGISDTAQAWTDAKTRIVFNRTLLKELDRGMAGALRALGALVHEYLHDENTAGSHMHDETFYQRFHDVMINSDMGTAAFKVYQNYVSRLVRVGVKVPTQLLKELSFAEKLDSGAIAEADPVKDAEALAEFEPAPELARALELEPVFELQG